MLDMDTINKPIASIGIRFIVATISLLGSVFLIIGVAIPGSTFNLFGPLFAVDERSIAPSTAITILLIGRLLYLCLLPVFGFLGDKFGRLKLIITGLILVGLSVTCMSFASIPMLFGFAVFCLNIGIAMTIPCLLSFMLEAVTSRWLLSFAAVIYLSGIYAADLVSPIVGGRLSSQGSMTNLFLLAGAIAAGGLLLGGIFALIAQIVKNRFRWHDDWLDHTQNQHQRVKLVLLLAIVFFVGISSSLYSNSYQFLNQLNLISKNDLALLMTSFSMSFFLGFSNIGILSDLLNWLSLKFIKRNIGRISILFLGLLIGSIGYGLAAISKVQPNTTLYSTMVQTIMCGAGFGISLPTLIALIAEQVPHRRWGITISGYFALYAISIFAAPSITGWLLDASGYSPQLSTQPISAHITITSTIPWLALISISIALIISIIVFVISVRPLQDLSSVETN